MGTGIHSTKPPLLPRARRRRKWLVIGTASVTLIIVVALVVQHRADERRRAAAAKEAEAVAQRIGEALARAEKERREERIDTERRFLSVPQKLKLGMDSRVVAQHVVPLVGKPHTDHEKRYGVFRPDVVERVWEWDEWDRWNWKTATPPPDHCFFHLRLTLAGRDGRIWKLSRIEEWKSGIKDGDCEFQRIYPPEPPKEYDEVGPVSPPQPTRPAPIAPDPPPLDI